MARWLRTSSRLSVLSPVRQHGRGSCFPLRWLSHSDDGSTRSSNSDDPNLEPRLRFSTTILLSASWTGIGQVIFLKSETAGKILLASLAVGDPLLAGMAAVGTITSTTTALAVAQLDSSTTQAGLYTYNGCLVGCAASVFMGPTCGILSLLSVTVTGAASSTLLTAALSRVTSPMPQWTYAFNIVTLSILLHAQPLFRSTEASIDATTTVTPTIPDTVSLLSLALAPLTGVSQIFVVDSVYTGLGIVAATATYSPSLALHALVGSATGAMVGGFVLQAPWTDVAMGLYGYNAALTSMGVAVFFVPTRQSYALSMLGAAASTVVFGALQPVLATYGSPCLTLPFCLTMSACWALGSPPVVSTISTNDTSNRMLVPGLILARHPHSPERNS